MVAGPPSGSMSLGADGVVSYRGGAGAFGLGLAVDAHRFGVNTQFISIYLPVDNGGCGGDGRGNIGLFLLPLPPSPPAPRPPPLRAAALAVRALSPSLATPPP